MPFTANGNVAFWIGADRSGVFDELTLRFIAERAGIVVLNAPLADPLTKITYANIVKRLHELRPGLPVLMYAWATRWHDTVRIGSSILQGYPDLGPLLLHRPDGSVLSFPDMKGLLFGDVRRKEYRNWALQRIQTMISTTGTDGVAIDSLYVYPPRLMREIYKSDPSFKQDHANGVEALLQDAKERFRPRPFLVNGLLGGTDGVQVRENILTYADGLAIEYFGGNPKRPPPPFDENILPSLEVISRHPDKLFLVFGRSSKAYVDYLEDYMWQRYLYCAYLLVASPNTLFKQHAHYQAHERTGRTNGLTTYGDWYLDIGEPQGTLKVVNGLYVRRFGKALVLLAPHSGSGGTYSLPQTMYTPEGERLSGTVIINPGKGFLLLDKPVDPPDLGMLDFYEQEPMLSLWPRAEVREETNGNKYLHLQRSPKRREWEHDLMLDPVRTLSPASTLRMKVRSTEPNARIILVAEVDDLERKYYRVALEVVSISEGASRPSIGQSVNFRSQ
jgi:hypothetical protein